MLSFWAMTAPQNLGAKAKHELTNSNNELIVSTASLFELTIKINIGKLVYKGGLSELFRDIDTAKFTLLPIEKHHLLEYAKLPLHHRDPFDRLIIAQAKAEKLTVVSKDANFKKYGVQVIW